MRSTRVTAFQTIFRPVCYAAVASAVLIPVGIRVFFGVFFPKELILGWILAYINATAASALDARAVPCETTGFLLWGLAFNLVRLGVFGGLMVACYNFTELVFMPFLTATMIGFFVFLLGEVIGLHRVAATL